MTLVALLLTCQIESHIRYKPKIRLKMSPSALWGKIHTDEYSNEKMTKLTFFLLLE